MKKPSGLRQVTLRVQPMKLRFLASKDWLSIPNEAIADCLRMETFTNYVDEIDFQFFYDESSKFLAIVPRKRPAGSKKYHRASRGWLKGFYRKPAPNLIYVRSEALCLRLGIARADAYAFTIIVDHEKGQLGVSLKHSKPDNARRDKRAAALAGKGNKERVQSTSKARTTQTKRSPKRGVLPRRSRI